MKRLVGLGALVVVGGLAIVNAQPKPEEPKVVTVEKVKDNLFVLRGGGGNTAVLVMANGVAVVDAKNPGWGQPILAKIKELTPKPVSLLINTHTHGDHVSGNVEFPASVDVVVQDNTRTNMEKMPIFKEHNNAGMAKRTFKDKMTIGQGADQIDLYYFGRGHTNGDAWIVFPTHRIVHSGDIFSGKNVPLIDTGNGGSMLQIAETLKKAHEGIKNVDRSSTATRPRKPPGPTSRSTASSTRIWSRGCGPDSRRARRRNSSPPSGRCPRSTRATRPPSARSWAAWSAASRRCRRKFSRPAPTSPPSVAA